eukprot:scaffold10498_cov179-Ochromonas_danica.AAC.3
MAYCVGMMLAEDLNFVQSERTIHSLKPSAEPSLVFDCAFGCGVLLITVCSQPGYAAAVLTAVPSLLLMDGGHVQIHEAFGSIEDELAKLRPDPSICKTPPSEPWFTAAELAVSDPLDTGATTTGPSSKSLKAVQEQEKTIQNMLSEDCSHLLRKAQAALAKTSGTR